MTTTLPQRLYLLCYTVDKGKFQLDNIQGRGQLLRAGALTELARDGLLDAEGRKVIRKPGKAPDDSFAAAVWGDLPDSKPKGWLNYVHNKAHTAETPVRDQLAAAGEVTVSRGRVMGVIPADRVTVTDPEAVRTLQERVRDTVLGGADPASIPLDELTSRIRGRTGADLRMDPRRPPHPQTSPQDPRHPLRRDRPGPAQGTARLVPVEPGGRRRLERLSAREPTESRKPPAREESAGRGLSASASAEAGAGAGAGASAEAGASARATSSCPGS